MIRPVIAIAGRDLRALFATATGWLVLGGFLLLAGVFWIALLEGYVARSQDAIFDPYAAVRSNLTDHLLGPFFGNLTLLLVVVGPAVTMRSFADEVRLHTVELLATAPLHAWQIALGKLLGAWAFVALALLAILWMPLSLYAWASPDPGAIFGGGLAVLLFGLAVCALGTLASSLTDSALVALVLSFSATLALWVAGRIDPDPTSLPSQLSLSQHLVDLVRGAVRLSDVAYFLLLAAWATFATWQRVEAWRYT